jgi:hypothetical protein
MNTATGSTRAQRFSAGARPPPLQLHAEPDSASRGWRSHEKCTGVEQARHVDGAIFRHPRMGGRTLAIRDHATLKTSGTPRSPRISQRRPRQEQDLITDIVRHAAPTRYDPGSSTRAAPERQHVSLAGLASDRILTPSGARVRQRRSGGRSRYVFRTLPASRCTFAVGPNRPAIASRAAAMFSENARGKVCRQ